MVLDNMQQINIQLPATSTQIWSPEDLYELLDSLTSQDDLYWHGLGGSALYAGG
jgi:hypothetical protein